MWGLGRLVIANLGSCLGDRVGAESELVRSATLRPRDDDASIRGDHRR